jgi:ferrous iron transport protein A
MDKRTSTIQALPIGGTGVIADVRGPLNAVRRIHELGLTKGTTVTIVRRAPFGGPIEVSIDGTHLAVRLADGLIIDVHTNGR